MNDVMVVIMISNFGNTKIFTKYAKEEFLIKPS